MNFLKLMLGLTFFILLTGCSKIKQENKALGIDKVTKITNYEQNNINIKLVKEAELALAENNYIKANLLYDKACNNNNAKACLNIGVSYEKGYGVIKNKLKASKLYEKSCNGNFLLACHYLGDFNYNRKNYLKSSKLYLKACSGNIIKSCNALAEQYQTGIGIKKDIELAIKLYSKSCKGNNSYACNSLGAIYGNGFIVKRNYEAAMKYLKLSCKLGNNEGCNNYNRIIEKSNLKKLVLIKENHAVLKFENVEYTLDSYIVMFENPYYIVIERSDNQTISKEKAIEIAIEYIKPRGCNSTIKLVPELDRNNANKTKWLIGISC